MSVEYPISDPELQARAYEVIAAWEAEALLGGRTVTSAQNPYLVGLRALLDDTAQENRLWYVAQFRSTMRLGYLDLRGKVGAKIREAEAAGATNRHWAHAYRVLGRMIANAKEAAE